MPDQITSNFNISTDEFNVQIFIYKVTDTEMGLIKITKYRLCMPPISWSSHGCQSIFTTGISIYIIGHYVATKTKKGTTVVVIVWSFDL